MKPPHVEAMIDWSAGDPYIEVPAVSHDPQFEFTPDEVDIRNAINDTLPENVKLDDDTLALIVERVVDSFSDNDVKVTDDDCGCTLQDWEPPEFNVAPLVEVSSSLSLNLQMRNVFLSGQVVVVLGEADFLKLCVAAETLAELRQPREVEEDDLCHCPPSKRRDGAQKRLGGDLGGGETPTCLNCMRRIG